MDTIFPSTKIYVSHIVVLVIFLSSWPGIIQAQYRIEGIAPDSIEQMQIDRDSLNDLSEYAISDSLSTILFSYWEERAKVDTQKEVQQNYLLEKTHALSVRYREGYDNKALVPVVVALEGEFQSNIGPDNISYSKYYNLLGIMYMSVVADRGKAREIFLKQQENDRKYFGVGTLEDGRSMVFIAETYRLEGKYDQAMSTHLEALKIINKTSPNSKEELQSLMSIGLTYYRQYKFEDALKYFLQGLELNFKNRKRAVKEILNCHMNAADCYRRLNLLDSALIHSENAVASARALYGLDSRFLVPIYQLYSLIHIYSGSVAKGTTVMDSAIQILNALNSTRNLAAMNYNRGLVETDLQSRLKFFKDAIDVCPEDARCLPGYMISFYNGLATTYLDKGDLDAAESYYQKALEAGLDSPQRANEGLHLIYNNLSIILSRKGNNKQAIEYLKKGIELVKESEWDAYTEALLKGKMALILQEENRLNEAETVFQEALEVVNTTQTHEGRKSEIYRQFTQYKIIDKDYEKAIRFVDSSMISLKNTYGRTFLQSHILLLKADIHEKSGDETLSKNLLHSIDSIAGLHLYKNSEGEIPELQLWRSFESLIDFVQIEDNLDPLDELETIKRIELGNSLIERIRNQFFFEVTEFEFQKSTNEFYNWALTKLNLLYSENQNKELLDRIYNCIEMSKSISLNRNHQRFMAVAKNKIPQSWIDKEKNLLYKYQQAYDKYSSIDTFNLENSNALVELQNEKQLFLDSLQQLYPEYYQNRYDQKVSSLTEIKNLSKKQNNAFVVYHLTDSLLLSLTINGDAAAYNAVSRRSLDKNLATVLVLVNDRTSINDENKYLENKSSYIQSARSLYNILINHESLSNQQKLTIIPDGSLSALPFDILLYENVEPSLKYAELPYLIKNFTINYLGSATQAVNYDRVRDRAQLKSYIGFGPSYSRELIKRDSSGFRGSELLTPLLYNEQEIVTAAEIFGGAHYIGTKAKESVFNENASGFDILHLAMHAILNDGVPMESYLSFGSDDDGGQLYVHEIAKMNLGNELVVLSACETNKDSYESGEGVLGIARAFQLAACPNIVLSNWLVDDKSASEIVSTFFRNIKNEKNPPQALREAKLEYIRNSSAIKSHPSYWAAFSYYGSENNDESSFITTKVSAISFGLLILLLIFLFFLRPLFRN